LLIHLIKGFSKNADLISHCLTLHNNLYSSHNRTELLPLLFFLAAFVLLYATARRTSPVAPEFVPQAYPVVHQIHHAYLDLCTQWANGAHDVPSHLRELCGAFLSVKKSKLPHLLLHSFH
jgi:hypothetical protein